MSEQGTTTDILCELRKEVGLLDEVAEIDLFENAQREPTWLFLLLRQLPALVHQEDMSP